MSDIAAMSKIGGYQPKDRRYRIVHFIQEKSKAGEAVIDIVPLSWITLTSEDEGRSLYPPYPFLNVEKMVKNLCSPGLTWQEYPVKIIGRADTYEEGMVKVKKAKTSLSASTDEDISKPYQEACTKALSLDHVPTFPSPGGDSLSHKLQSGKKPALFESSSDDEIASQSSKEIDGGVSDSALTKPKGPRHDAKRPCKFYSDSETPATDSPLKKRKGAVFPFEYERRTADRDSAEKMKALLTQSKKKKSDRDSVEKARRSLVKDKTFAEENNSRTTAVRAGRQSTENNETGKHALSRTSSHTPVGTNRASCDRESSPVRSAADKSFDTKIKNYLSEMEKRLGDRIDRVRRSVTHDTKKISLEIRELQAVLKQSGVPGAGDGVLIGDYRKKWSLPFKTIESFEDFEKALLEVTEYDDLVKVLRVLWIPKGKLSKLLLAVLERFFTKEVALRFSAQGKGKLKKANFSATTFYSGLEKIVLDSETDVHPINIKSVVGKILANAGDWEGGRLLRQKNSVEDEKDTPGGDKN